MDNIHIQLITEALNLSKQSVSSTIGLLREGATIPFIARYRKEATGSLDEVNIADIQSELKNWKNLTNERKPFSKPLKNRDN